MVAKVLEQLTDEDHPLTAYDIVDILNNCGFDCEYRSVLRDLKQLDEFYSTEIDNPEYEDVLSNDNALEFKYTYENRGYRMIQRPFEYEDVQILMECVDNAKFISNKKANELKNKLGSLRSVYEKKKLMKVDVFSSGRAKTTDRNIINLMASINEAIEHNHKLSFIYKDYRIIDGKITKVDRRGGKPIVVSPYRLMMNDSYYYLISFDDKRKQIVNYRVDRMENTCELKEKREGYDVFSHLTLNTYTKESFNMFDGKRTLVTIRFTNDLLYTIIDRFGTKDIEIHKDDPKHFYLRTYVFISTPFFGWLWSFGNKAMLISPEDVLDDYLDRVQVQAFNIVKTQKANKK